jgi:large subunit ribosomal protein L5
MSSPVVKILKNPMRRVMLDKVTINIGVGESGDRLQKAFKLLEEITNSKPVYTIAKKTIKEFGIRKGQPIGVKVTLRGKKAEEILKKLLAAVDYRLKESSFDSYGNITFGITEHVMIPGAKYDPEVGIFGMDVAITLKRPGYRVMLRRRKRASIPKRHRVTKEEAIEFLKSYFNVKIIK